MNAPATRSLVTYEWHADEDSEDVDEAEVERLLAAAKRDGLVWEYSARRVHDVWFNAPAGVKARALKRKIDALIPPSWTRGRL